MYELLRLLRNKIKTSTIDVTGLIYTASTRCVIGETPTTLSLGAMKVIDEETNKITEYMKTANDKPFWKKENNA